MPVRSLKKSERLALIAFIKPKKKKFYRSLWKWYGHRGVLLSLRNTLSSPIKDFLFDQPQNYGLAAELNIIYEVLKNDLWDGSLKGGIGLPELMFLHTKYWERFHQKFVFPRTRKKTPLPHMKKTEAVMEFLARGFVHKDEAVNFRGKKYTIECTIAHLMWPGGFDTHSEACAKGAELGIPGYTKCPIPS